MTKEELHENVNGFLKDAQDVTEATMATLTTLMMKHHIPSQIGIPMITDIHRMAHESSLKTAMSLGYKSSATEALQELAEQSNQK